MKRAQTAVVLALAAWMLLATSAVTVLTWPNPRVRAVLGMGWGLIILWIILGGTLMRCFREPIAGLVRRVNFDWRIKFVVFATGLALLDPKIHFPPIS